MKIQDLTNSLCRALVATVVVFGASAAVAAPTIFAPEQTFDFGKMDDQLSVDHDFVIVNVGTDTLEIKNVKTTCGCTVAEMKKKVLAPGEETVVSAKFNLKGKQGKQEKPITIESNDPENPRYIVKLVGEAVPSISVEPRFFNLGTIEDDGTHTASVTVSANKPGVSFNITDIQVTNDQLKVEKKVVEEGKTYELVLSNTAPLKDGFLNVTVTAMTDHPDRPALIINASGRVVGQVDLRPDTLNVIYREDQGGTTKQNIAVGPGRVKEFQITGVSTDAEGVKTQILPRGTNNYIIEVSDIPQNESIEGKSVTVTTNLPDRPEIVIPFKLTRMKSGFGANPSGAGLIPPQSLAAPPAAPVAAPAN